VLSREQIPSDPTRCLTFGLDDDVGAALGS